MLKMETNELLNLIAGIDPTDSEFLEIINFKFHVWRLQIPVIRNEWLHFSPSDWGDFYIFNNHGESLARIPAQQWNVAGSRDALKLHRPEGWDTYAYRNWSMKGSIGVAHNNNPRCPVPDCSTYKALPTEELAELHVIIQAINYERMGF
jgi:hypothetical protein